MRYRAPQHQAHRLADHHVPVRLPLDARDQRVYGGTAQLGQRHGHAGDGTSRKARHSSSSKLTTDIPDGTLTPE
jgi:hypothetical protein